MYTKCILCTAKNKVYGLIFVYLDKNIQFQKRIKMLGLVFEVKGVFVFVPSIQSS